MGIPQIKLATAMQQKNCFRALPFALDQLLHSDLEQCLPGEETLEDAYARGVDAGKKLVEISHAVERKALLDLLASAEAFHHESCDDLAAMIAFSVEQLVQQIVVKAPVDADWLKAKAFEAASVVSEADQDRILFLNPEDAALVADCSLGMPIRTDESLARGDLRIQTGAGWVEIGRSTYMDALKVALASGGQGA